MGEEEEYNKCSEEILSEYQLIKNNLSGEETIVCQHLGSFSQDILISIVSLVEHALVQNGEFKSLQKRLSYLIIETIQNIMFHSDEMPDSSQLAYLLIVKSDMGYVIHSSNTIETKNIKSLVKKIDEFLAVKTDVLSKLFSKKIQTPEIDKKGHGGLGLLTIVSKTGKDFEYGITKVSAKYSLFHIKLTLNYNKFR